MQNKLQELTNYVFFVKILYQSCKSNNKSFSKQPYYDKNQKHSLRMVVMFSDLPIV